MSRQLGDELNNATNTGKSVAKAAKKGVKGGVKAAKGIKKLAMFLITNPAALIVLGICLIIMLGGLWIEQTITPGTDSNLYLTSIGDSDRSPAKEDRGKTIENMDPAVEETTNLLQIIADERYKQLEKAYKIIQNKAQKELTQEGVELTMSSVQDLTEGGMGLTKFIPDVGSASSGNNVIVEKARSYAWPKGTSENVYTKKPTDKYKKAASSYGYDTAISQTDCGSFVNTCVRSSGIDKNFKALAGTNDSLPDFNTKIFKNVKSQVTVNGKVDKNKLLPGDIIRYKLDSGQHTFLIIDSNTYAEASRGKKYPLVRSFSGEIKCNNSATSKSTTQVLRVIGSTGSSVSVGQGIANWAIKYANNDKYYYKRWKEGDSNTHKCPLCHPGTGDGWQCIGFATAACYHGGGIKTVKCGCGGSTGLTNGSSAGISLEDFRKRNGKNWDMLKAGSSGDISQSKLQVGDILNCWSGGSSHHWAVYVGNGEVAHARTDTCKKADQIAVTPYKRLCSSFSVKYAYRYTGGGSVTSDDPVAPISNADLDILSIYSASLGNTGLKAPADLKKRKEGTKSGTLDKTYTDMKGNAIPIYRFGEKKGQIKYEKDLKKKFSLLNPNKVQFFDVKMQSAIATLYDASGNPYQVKYYQSTITDRDIAEISKDTFGVDLDDEYPNASIGGSITTNMQAVTTFSETTQKTLFPNGFGNSDAGFIVVNGKYKNPVGNASYFVTSEFNVKGDSVYHMDHYHAGIDLGVPVGTKIIATVDGTITRASYFGGYGNCVDLQAGDYLFRFGHLSRFLCSKGQKVTAGQVIALSGNTGNSEGPHLHFEVQYKGTPVNPRKFVKFK